MKKLITAGAIIALVASSQAVTLQKGEKRWTIANDAYKITLNSEKGFKIASISMNGVEKGYHGQFVYGYDMQPATFTRQAGSPDVKVWQREATAKVISETPEKIVIEVKWGDETAKVVELLTFDNSPAVGVSIAFDWQRIAGTPFYLMQCQEGDANADATCFYPESRNFRGVHEHYRRGKWSALPGWKHLKEGDYFGVGVVAAENCGWENFVFASRRPAKEVWGSGAWIELTGKHLVDEKLPGHRNYELKLVFAADEQVTHKVANDMLKSAPKVQLCDISPDKVHSKPGKKNGLKTTIVNNTELAQKVKVEVELFTGLDEVRKISEETIELKPCEMRPYYKDWSYDQDFRWGVTMRVRVSDAETGKLLDYRADVTGVHERGFAVAGVCALNSGTAIQDGFEETWPELMHNTYEGMMEYYAWSPSTWDPEYKTGQAPVGDDWEPCSDSQMYYRSRISKKFLKGFIDAAHERGTDMIDWITGLVNYRMAVRNPTKFQYSKNGQLLIYASRVWGDNERLAVAKIAPYTVEDARDWGEQTAASVDMFGWDGCRWDWGFLPTVPNDPLYQNAEGVASKDLEWYNWEGKVCWDLFPDPEKTACECGKAFLDAVHKRHPNFVNTCNLGAGKKTFGPYNAMRVANGMGLLEYLIGFDSLEKYNTFAKWTKILTEDSNRMRKVNAHSEVGAIGGFSVNSPATKYARYACHAAGSKWWGGGIDQRYWGAWHHALPFAMRFSEYFWGTEYLQIEDETERFKKVTVLNGDHLLWKDFIFERKDGKRRELVFHIVNVEPDSHFYVRCKESAPVKNLQVKLGVKVKECWVAQPGIEPTIEKLPVKNGILTIPEMKEATMVVVKY